MLLKVSSLGFPILRRVGMHVWLGACDVSLYERLYAHQLDIMVPVKTFICWIDLNTILDVLH